MAAIDWIRRGPDRPALGVEAGRVRHHTPASTRCTMIRASIAALLLLCAIPHGAIAESGAQLLRDCNTTSTGGLFIPPSAPARAGSLAFFGAHDRLGPGLWRTDGTLQGTYTVSPSMR